MMNLHIIRLGILLAKMNSAETGANMMRKRRAKKKMERHLSSVQVVRFTTALHNKSYDLRSTEDRKE